MWKWVLVLVMVLGLAGGTIAFVLVDGGTPDDAAGSADNGDGETNGEGAAKNEGAFGSLMARFRSEQQGTEVQVEPARLGDLVRTVSAPGSIEPRTLVEISSQVSAEVIALPYREGDRVEKGEVVVRLDPKNLLAQLQSAKASLKIEEARLDGAKADLINARLGFERSEQLYETGDAPKSELDSAEAAYLQAQSNLKAIEAQIAVAEANIERVQRDLDNTVIESPIAGTVTALFTEVGETSIVGTTNTPGSVLMEIADRDQMLLIAQVDETNIAPVEEGQTATVFINAYGDREYTGTVERIGLTRQVSAQGTGYFEVEIAIELAEGETLRNGLTASTDIAVETFFDVVKVPSQAVLDRRVDELPRDLRDHPLVDAGRTFARMVYRFEEGEAKATPVQTGPSDLRDTMIEAGLEAGSQVIVGPYSELGKLKDGRSVRRESEEEAEEAAPEEPERVAAATGGEEESSAE